MKGNKKVLVAAVLLLLMSVCFTTYAIYRSRVSGEGTVRTAKWLFKVDGTNVETTSVSLDSYMSNISWTNNVGENGTIAPGATGTITIPVDATGSEVPVKLTANLTANGTLPDGMTATVTSGNAGVQSIPYSSTNMSANVVVTITWTGTENDAQGKDTTDKAAQDTTYGLTLNLEARQALPGE